MVRSRSFLLTLPVELVHCILDYLDIDTILFSFRYVCKTFYLITKIYNRLTLELSDDPWETPFDYLNEIISYENVERLILQKFNVNNELNNINQFFSLSEIHRLTRLRCVILVRIDENNFRTIMCHLATLSTLKSLAIYERRIWKNDTNLLLSTVLALPSLRQIHLDVHSQILDEISWPNPGKFRELILKNCSYKQWCHILSRLSNLQIVSVGNFDLNYIEKRVSSITTHWQLTSLTLSHIQFPISQLEMVLSSYPSLLYLNFTAKNTLSFASLRQFSRWERFLGDKLPRLKHFHFEISSPVVRSHEFDYIKTLIAAFRTPFWLQYKHWYTKFQYVINNHGARFIISSLINEHRDLFDKLKKDFLLFFTSTREDDHGWNANFNLSDMEQAILSAQVRRTREKKIFYFLLLSVSNPEEFFL